MRKADLKIEAKTKAASHRLAKTLPRLSPEQILTELYRIFSDENSFAVIELMDEQGVLEGVFPEIAAMKGCTQNGYHHLDVWEHSLAVLGNCEYIINHLDEFFAPASGRITDNLRVGNRLPLLKLAALLHDVGKPDGRKIKPAGQCITFYGHDRKGAGIVSAVADRLSMPDGDRAFLETLVAEHLHIFDLSEPNVRKTTLARFRCRLKEDLVALVILGLADIQAKLGPLADEKRRHGYLQWSRQLVIDFCTEILKPV